LGHLAEARAAKLDRAINFERGIIFFLGKTILIFFRTFPNAPITRWGNLSSGSTVKNKGKEEKKVKKKKKRERRNRDT